MTASASPPAPNAAEGSPDRPDADVLVCESRPGRTVFLESGNTDRWIASDTTVDLDP